MKKIILITAALILTSTFNSMSQLKKEEFEMYMRVKQIGEFINRFNYKTDVQNMPISEKFAREVPRQAYLDMLFNAEDSRLAKNSPGHSESYAGLKDEFIQHVCKQGAQQYINLSDNSLFAVLTCKVTYQKRPATAKLVMQRVQEYDGSVAWVPVGCSADFIKKPSKTGARVIAPGANETNYQEYTKNLDKYALDFFPEEMDFSSLSVFFSLVDQGIVSFKYVEKQAYHFTSIRGWAFRAENFNRKTQNSGWLIAGLERVGDRNAYLDKLPVEKFIMPKKPAPAVSCQEHPPPVGRVPEVGYGLAWAATDALYTQKSIAALKDGLETLYSPWFVYKVAEKNVPKIKNKPLSLNNILYQLKHVGCLPISDFPDEKKALTDELIKKAAAHKIKDYMQVVSKGAGTQQAIKSVKHALFGKNIVIAEMILPLGFRDIKKTWPGFTVENNPKKFRHALVVVGYDDNKNGGAFRGMNCFGEKWGDNGFIDIPYKDFARFMNEAYTIKF